MTGPELWALWQQKKRIWDLKSGESLSVTLFSCNCSGFFAYGLYYLDIGSVIAAFNGITSSLIQVPILIGLWKFKRLLWWEKTLFFVFPFMPAIMWFSPPEAKDNLFLALTLITLVPACRQPYEMWRAGTRGAVEIKFFGTQLINCAVWMAFAFSIGTWVVILCQSLMTLTVIATVALWCWYRAKEPNPPK